MCVCVCVCMRPCAILSESVDVGDLLHLERPFGRHRVVVPVGR